MTTRDWKTAAEAARATRLRLKEWAVEIYKLDPNARPYGQRGVYPKPPYPLAADGSRLCRWCGVPIGKGRWWCGPDCVGEFMRRGHWPTMAKFITDRDKVCRLCGGGRFDVTAPHLHYCGDNLIDGKTWGFWQISAREGGPDHRPQVCALKVTWAVDHIQAVKDGGTDDPENLRLLCGRCHGEVTAAQHQRWALERRAAASAQQTRLEFGSSPAP